ncbi:hypothetical protein NMG60_11009603 [Bertholletia excelsa]
MRNQRVSEDQINDLLFKLHALLPASTSRCHTRVTASEVLKEICTYIQTLHREVDDLSLRLSHLLASTGTSDMDANLLRILLQQ